MVSCAIYVSRGMATGLRIVAESLTRKALGWVRTLIVLDRNIEVEQPVYLKDFFFNQEFE